MVADKTAVGVPEITQVVALIDNVPGRAVVPPLIAQAVTDAPLAVTVGGVTDMAVFTEPEVPVAPVKSKTGAEAATVRLTVASAELPTEFVAIKV